MQNTMIQPVAKLNVVDRENSKGGNCLTMNSKLILCHPHEVVREMLDLFGFSTILHVTNSEAEAITESHL